MAKLKLKPNPTFPLKVGVHVPGHEPDEVVLTAKHRSKDDMAEFIKAVSDMKDDASVILAIATGWDLDNEFSEENVRALVNDYVDAPRAVFERYLEELSGNRRKN